MRVMVLVKATADSEKGFDLNAPGMKQMMEDMGRFNDELSKAGILVTADGLLPSSGAKPDAFAGHNPRLSPGRVARAGRASPSQLVVVSLRMAFMAG